MSFMNSASMFISSVPAAFANVFSSPTGVDSKTSKTSKAYNVAQRGAVVLVGGTAAWSGIKTVRTIDRSSDNWKTQCQKGALATVQIGAGALAILAAFGK